MSVFQRIPWWAWVLGLVPVVFVLLVTLGWFPVLAGLIGWLLMKVVRMQPTEAESVGVGEIVGQPPDIVWSVVSKVSNEQLCEFWTQSSRELRRAYLPASISSYACLRQALLEEMERRDAEAVDRWLADGADQHDPRGYLARY